MRTFETVMLTALMAFSAALSSQARAQEAVGPTPMFETSVGYTFIHANAPPAQCGCFSANGGYGSVVFNLPHSIGLVADFTAVHANNISGTTQSITVFNYLFGPRYSLRSVGRFVPYAQVLGGGSRESSTYTAVQSVKGGAFSLGGGVNTTISRHFGWTIVEADWVHSLLPNAHNNLQNDLRISSGISFQFGKH